jgi:hypothetical protein
MKKLIAATVAACVLALVVVGAPKVIPGSLIGTDSHTETTQVINAVTREQQVVLLALGIQGITDAEKNSKVLGIHVPGSGEKMLIQYNFNAKVGIDGKDVTIKKTGPHAFGVTIPSFIFIGHSNESFKKVLDDGGVLSGVTPDIDETELINDVLNDKAQKQYVSSNEDTLKDQAQAYYRNLIASIAPKATVTFSFVSAS